jgi:hypothetical protein
LFQAAAATTGKGLIAQRGLRRTTHLMRM